MTGTAGLRTAGVRVLIVDDEPVRGLGYAIKPPEDGR